MLRRINDALPGLVLGIIVYGVIVELAGVWFVTDKVRYTTGLLIGISLACGMAVNIATVLRDAVELYGEDNAKKKIVAKSLAPLCCRCDRFLCYDEMESGKSDHCIYRGIGT